MGPSAAAGQLVASGRQRGIRAFSGTSRRQPWTPVWDNTSRHCGEIAFGQKWGENAAAGESTAVSPSSVSCKQSVVGLHRGETIRKLASGAQAWCGRSSFNPRHWGCPARCRTLSSEGVCTHGHPFPKPCPSLHWAQQKTQRGHSWECPHLLVVPETWSGFGRGSLQGVRIMPSFYLVLLIGSWQCFGQHCCLHFRDTNRK